MVTRIAEVGISHLAKKLIHLMYWMC